METVSAHMPHVYRARAHAHDLEDNTITRKEALAHWSGKFAKANADRTPLFIIRL